MRQRLAAVLVLGFLTASGAAGAQRGPANGAAQASLNRAADALLALKSTRFSIKREGAPAFLDEKSGITFTSADCIYAAPDRVSCSVKVGLKNGSYVQLTRVWVPEGMFQSNPLTHQYAKLPPDANFNGSLLFARTGIAGVLKTDVTKVAVVGKEPVQGRDTLHLKGEVSGAKLNPLIGSTLKADLTYPVDLWMDDATGNAVQLHVAEPDGNGWMIELSGANEPQTIPTPQLPPAAGR